MTLITDTHQKHNVPPSHPEERDAVLDQIDLITRRLNPHPIHRLPLEILLKIFQQSSKEYTNTVLPILGNVCQAWQDVVVHSASLWTMITISDKNDADMICLSLSLSQSLPLSVILRSESELPSNQIYNNLRLLDGQQHRIRHFLDFRGSSDRYLVGDSSDLRYEIMDCPFSERPDWMEPRSDSATITIPLTLQSLCAVSWSSDLKMCLPKMHSLTRLTMFNLSGWTFSPLYLPNLQSLTLKDLDGSSLLSLLLSLSSHCPIVSLKVYRWYSEDHLNQFIQLVNIATLIPTLRDLDLIINTGVIDPTKTTQRIELRYSPVQTLRLAYTVEPMRDLQVALDPLVIDILLNFPRLRTLHLPSQLRISVPSLKLAVSGFELLQKLQLSWGEDEGYGLAQVPGFVPPVTLPKLLDLDLHGNADFVTDFMHTMIMPVLMSLRIDHSAIDQGDYLSYNPERHGASISRFPLPRFPIPTTSQLNILSIHFDAILLTDSFPQLKRLHITVRTFILLSRGIEAPCLEELSILQLDARISSNQSLSLCPPYTFPKLSELAIPLDCLHTLADQDFTPQLRHLHISKSRTIIPQPLSELASMKSLTRISFEPFSATPWPDMLTPLRHLPSLERIRLPVIDKRKTPFIDQLVADAASDSSVWLSLRIIETTNEWPSDWIALFDFLKQRKRDSVLFDNAPAAIEMLVFPWEPYRSILSAMKLAMCGKDYGEVIVRHHPVWSESTGPNSSTIYRNVGGIKATLKRRQPGDDLEIPDGRRCGACYVCCPSGCCYNCIIELCDWEKTMPSGTEGYSVTY